MPNRKANSIKNVVRKYLNPDTEAIMTDGYNGYKWLDSEYGIPRGVVIHKYEFKNLQPLEVIRNVGRKRVKV